jgi:ubiquinone/menaquinone biosynthesis C-methylase UbiE
MATGQLSPKTLSAAAEIASGLEYTGERLVPGRAGEGLFREHEERYVFAAQYVAGKDVVDVACGAGVGTSLLLHAGAHSILGLDIDPATVAYAKERYRDCRFAECDATSLCLPDQSIDVVVSFETLEHLHEQDKFLKECWRVLRAGGRFICSTPNLAISRWSARNPHHVREFYAEEFSDLVGSVFPCLELFAQRNRMLPFYAARKLIRRRLDELGYTGSVDRVLRLRSQPEMFRTEFVNDVSRFRTSIVAYKRGIFREPIFLIAVAQKTPA